MSTPSPVPEPSFDGNALLESAAQWRRAARLASTQGDWEKVDAALNMAETTYAQVLRLGGSDALTDRATEGQARCRVLRSDVDLRHWRLPEAEAMLDEAYKLFKSSGENGAMGAELWRLTARLAERQGRWKSAKAAWKRVVKLAEERGEIALGDALVRLAELEIIDDRPEEADELLVRADQLGRDMEDDLLRARVSSVRAAELEAQGLFAAAWDAWQYAQGSVMVAPLDYTGLMKLRMAATAVQVRPDQAFRLVETGYEALLEARHPDALGLGYHQLAVLALLVKDPQVAALAAVGAQRCRGGYEDTTRPLLAQALRELGYETTAERLEDASVHLGEKELQHMLARTAEERDVAWDELGSEAVLIDLCGRVNRTGPASAQIQIDADGGRVVDPSALVRHRATLSWDAPVDVVGDQAPSVVLKVAPTPPPVQRTVAPPRPSADDGEDTTLAQRTATPAARPRRTGTPVGDRRLTGTPLEGREFTPGPNYEWSTANLILAMLSVILFFAGAIALGIVILLQFVQ